MPAAPPEWRLDRRARAVAAMLGLAMTGPVQGADHSAEASGEGRASQTCVRDWLPPPVVALDQEPQARLLVDAPIASQLAQGRVVIRYCAENVRILPVFGEAALKVSPRLGHLHVTVDEGPYRWLDTSGQPVIVNKLPPGPHRILLELVDPTHRTLDRQVVHFTIPESPTAH